MVPSIKSVRDEVDNARRDIPVNDLRNVRESLEDISRRIAATIHGSVNPSALEATRQVHRSIEVIQQARVHMAELERSLETYSRDALTGHA